MTIKSFQCKGSSGSNQIEVDDIVHILDDGHRMHWKLPKVEEVYPGHDDIIRAAKVRLPTLGGNHSSVVRPIQHLYPLEVNKDNNTQVTHSASYTIIR